MSRYHVRCEHCHFWHHDGFAERGECRRRSPTLIYSRDEPRAQWPLTEPGEFCGEGSEVFRP